MSDSGRARASTAVDSLVSEGSTDIKKGLKTGVRVLKERRHRNPVAGLILLSDGQDNCSDRSGPPGTYLLPTHRIPTHTFGFGSDHDAKAMHAIAAATGGSFSFVEEENQLQDAFAMCIGGLLSITAQKVEVLVASAWAEDVLIASVASGSFSSRVLNHGLAATIELGDLYADEEKDFLIHVSVPAAKGQQQTAMPLLVAKCSYKNPITGESVHIECETSTEIRRPDELSSEDKELSLTVDAQRNRILVGESIREAWARAERGDFEGAKGVLTSRREALLGSASGKAGDGICAPLDDELQETQKLMENAVVYNRSGRAYALSGLMTHQSQRSAGGATYAARAIASARRGDEDGIRRKLRSPFRYETEAMLDMVKKSREEQEAETEQDQHSKQVLP